MSITLAVIFSALSLIICGFSFIYLQSYLRRRTGAERILADFEEEVNKIIISIDAAADRDITLLEDKARSIKTLLETLDRRIAAYAREIDRKNNQEAAYSSLGRSKSLQPPSPDPFSAVEGAFSDLFPSSRTAPAPETIAGGGLPLTARSDPDQGTESDQEDFTGPSADADTASPTPRFVRSSNPLKPKAPPLTERVTELSRNGLSPDSIAARLGVTVAEVDLALAVSGWKQGQ